MSVATIARGCVDLLGQIHSIAATVDVFGPEARALDGKLADLRPLFNELLLVNDAGSGVKDAAEGVQAALRSFLLSVQLCAAQGPLQILLTGNQLLIQMVDACLCMNHELTRLQYAQLPTIIAAQARMLSAELTGCTVNHAALRRLHSVSINLQEEAERVRLGLKDEAAFSAMLVDLAATCTPQQLLSDAAFLKDRLSEARANQQHVQAHFLELAHTAIRGLLAERQGCSHSERGAAEARRSMMESAQGTQARRSAASSQAGGPSTAGRAAEAASPGAAVGWLGQLGYASTSQSQRVTLLEDLYRDLQGQGPERQEKIQALAEGGVALLVRVISTSASAVRSAALRVLVALLGSEPVFNDQLVAARGVPVLLHLLSIHLDAVSASQQRAVAAASAVVAIRTASPHAAGNRKAPYPHERKPASGMASPPDPRAQPQAGVGGDGEGVEEEVCVDAVMLMRLLLPTCMGEIVSSGALKALCRAAGLPGGGRLATSAIAALADAAHAGPAAVQMLQGRMLVTLADARSSERPSEVASALACTQALLQHPARLLRGRTSQDIQLCTELGKGCDPASVTALLDLLVEATEADVNGGRMGGILPALLEFVPFCLHSVENRATALRHSAAMRVLLTRAAEAYGTAATVLKRIASDDASKISVVRPLSQALTPALVNTNIRRAAAVALCLADIMRPTSRDRAESTGACSECQQCGAVPPLVALAHSPDATCRAAGLACLHALAVYGSQALRSALGECGAVLPLVDAVKLEHVGLPDALQPPICTPNTLAQAAAEALAALAAASDALRGDICMQLCNFLSSSTQLAASACQALLALVETTPAAGATLVSRGVMTALVALISKGSATPPGRDGGEAAAPGALQQTAVGLMWALCRGGGAAVDAAVEAGAAPALIQRLSAKTHDVDRRVETAAALGPLLKKSAAARDAACSQGGMTTLLQLAREAPTELPLWEDALTSLAALASLHLPSRTEATQALRQMLVRGSQREMAAAAVVVVRMSSSPSGREVLLAEDVVEPLVKLLTTGHERARAAAANTLSQLAVPAAMQLPACTALPKGGIIRPRQVLIRAGAVCALLELLRGAVDSSPRSSAASSCSCSPSSSRSNGGADVGSSVLVCVTEALDSIAAGEDGAQAIRCAGGIEVLKGIVARGKRRTIPEAMAKAASSALMHCV